MNRTRELVLFRCDLTVALGFFFCFSSRKTFLSLATGVCCQEDSKDFVHKEWSTVQLPCDPCSRFLLAWGVQQGPCSST